MAITPDTKDWTWTLEQRCPQCGLDASTVPPAQVAPAVLADVPTWRRVLGGPDARRRPAPDVWSPLEYACHVRDVHRVFAERFRQVLDEDDPVFENWDQDAAARTGRYDEQDPGAVADELAAAAAVVAERLAAVRDEQWQRPGRRSNGSAFTLGSLVQYYWHDVAHHRWDVDR